MTSKVDTNYTLVVLTNFLKVEYTGVSVHRNEYFFVSNVHMEVRDDDTYTIGDSIHESLTLDFNNCTNIIESTIEDFIESVTEILILASAGGGSPTSDVNLITIKGVSVATGKGVITAGTQRFTLGTDDCLNIAVSGIGTTTGANNVLLGTMDTSLNNIETTTTANNVLLGTIDSGISGLGVTTSSSVILISSIDDSVNDIGITMVADNILFESMDTSLNNIETTNTSIDTETTSLGITAVANNILFTNMDTSLDSMDTELTNTGTTTTANNVLLGDVVETTGDLGLARVKIDKSDFDPSYSYGSIIMDGVADSTERTGGMPLSGYNSKERVTFPEPDGIGYTLYVASSDADDNATSITGARKIALIGLGADWLPLSEEIVLDGQTPVASSNTNWLRINKLFVCEVGTNGTTNLGHLTIMASNDFTAGGLPDTTNPVSLISIGMGYMTIGILSIRKDERVYFTRGSYYTNASSTKAFKNTQYDTYPYDSSTPNVNRITINVGNLWTSSTMAFNTSGAAPEFPGTDIEFTAQTGGGGSNIDYSIYWNTMRSTGF